MHSAIVRRLALVLVALLACFARADEPEATFRLEGGRPHVGMPFDLALVVEGFEESPAPEQPALRIADAEVTPLGATPNVSRSVQIYNGRRREFVQVTWVLRWRIEASREGRLRVPETTVVQGDRRATAAAGDVEVSQVPAAEDMRLEIALPQRPVWVGETVPVTLIWRFVREPQDQTVAIPMLGLDAFVASAPPATNPRRVLAVKAGAKELHLPFDVDRDTASGASVNRLTATFHAVPRRAGVLDIPASSAVAALAVGRPDFFGSAPTRLFRVSDVPRKLEVRALPESGRPETFAGAVGSRFSIAVRTSRSVVQIGEPVELEIAIRSDLPLETLSLGRMDGDGRLPKDRFTVPAEPPTGEISEDGRTKTFRVTAQVTGPASEVPAIAFSFFDPERGTYDTIRSDPIALSVRGGTFVGAADVVAARPAKSGGPAWVDEPALVGADLALSGPEAVTAAPLDETLTWTLFGVLHVVPLGFLAWFTWRGRTQGMREERAEIRAARARAEELLTRAATEPAREIAGPLGAALREWTRVTGALPPDPALLARIETGSFDPVAASKPMAESVRAEARAVLRGATGGARNGGVRTAAAGGAIVALMCSASSAYAGPLEDGRAAYAAAMETRGDATARRAAFERAAVALGEAARMTPGRPELLADWGNAALGAGDVATATLAYRRALALDGGNLRAARNLAWLRSRQPDAFRPADSSAADALLFFHAWPRSRRLLLGAAAFAVTVLLLVPWTRGGRRRLTGLAVPSGAVWLVMVASVALEDRRPGDAVVTDDVVLRAADSAGAPAALAQALPRGVEVTIVEARGTWSRVRVASGTAGWVPAGAVERVAP